MRFNLLDPAKDNRWDEFVTGQEHGTIFHTSAWARVIQESYGYSPQYYVLEDTDGRPSAAIPLFQVRSGFTGNRLVCLPFSDACWPLGDAAGIELLVNRIKDEIGAGAASYLEIRGWQNGLSTDQLNLRARDYHLLYILDLEPGIDVIKANFHDSVRRGIRQAEKRGVTVRMTQTEADLGLFYQLHVVTRKKLGVLPQPRVFFDSVFRHLISKKLGFTGLAESEGKVIAGVVFLTYKDTLYYKFNASDENHLQKRPNHLVTWEAIRYACANQFKHLDLGRCSREEEGLMTYKARWGAKGIDLPYYYYPEVKGITAVSEKSARYRAMQLFSRVVPRFAFEAVGSLLYKHFG
jgi:CelD/BcsL family acetyltransferase involved in cellulose biosynthesis